MAISKGQMFLIGTNVASLIVGGGAGYTVSQAQLGDQIGSNINMDAASTVDIGIDENGNATIINEGDTTETTNTELQDTTDVVQEDEQVVNTIPTLTEFEQLMSKMDENDIRRTVSEDAMKLVLTFNQQTHSDSFRMEEDGDSYLDLSFEEALVLTTVANYSEPKDINEIYGIYDINEDKAKELLESARNKVMIYYMNAVNPSGLKDIFYNVVDSNYFGQFETSILEFNKDHSVEKSNEVIRLVYRNYVLDREDKENVGICARLLSADVVHGGVVLVESVDEEHTQFLVFQGNDADEEAKRLAESYGLDFSELTKEQQDYYRKVATPNPNSLIDIKDGVVMTEDNSTEKEREDVNSLEEMVNRDTLRISCDKTISDSFKELSIMNTQRIITSNYNILQKLYNAEEYDLASELAEHLNVEISGELLDRISQVKGMDEIKTTYLSDSRISMSEIVSVATNELSSKLDHYSPTEQDYELLSSNRIHANKVVEEEIVAEEVVEKESTVEAESVSTEEQTADNYSDSFNGGSFTEDVETEESINEGPQQTSETTNNNIDIDNVINAAAAKGIEDAVSYANEVGGYKFKTTVEDPINGEDKEKDGVSLINGIINRIASGNDEENVDTDDEQIKNALENAANNYVNGLDNSYIKDVANELGVSVDEAKERIKEAFKTGFIQQLKYEIELARQNGENNKNEVINTIDEIDDGTQIDDQSTNTQTDYKIEEGEKDLEKEGNPYTQYTGPEFEEGEKDIDNMGPNEISTPASEDLGASSEFVETDSSADVEQAASNTQETYFESEEIVVGQDYDQADSSRVESGESTVIGTPSIVEGTYDTTGPIDGFKVEEGEKDTPNEVDYEAETEVGDGSKVEEGEKDAPNEVDYEAETEVGDGSKVLTLGTYE